MCNDIVYYNVTLCMVSMQFVINGLYYFVIYVLPEDGLIMPDISNMLCYVFICVENSKMDVQQYMCSVMCLLCFAVLRHFF